MNQKQKIQLLKTTQPMKKQQVKIQGQKKEQKMNQILKKDKKHKIMKMQKIIQKIMLNEKRRTI